MSKTVLIIGHKGNMGTRYKKILDFIDIPWIGVDSPNEKINANDFTHAIIASPTDTHESWIKTFAMIPDLRKKPILCEKPVSMRPQFIGWLKKHREEINLRVVNQYMYLIDDFNREGNTHYMYFKHGNDGIIWDCFNIIGMAKCGIVLQEDSPVWTCKINGQRIDPAMMDYSYITMIDDWLRYGHEKNQKAIEYIINTSEKCLAMEREYAKNPSGYTSQEH